MHLDLKPQTPTEGWFTSELLKRRQRLEEFEDAATQEEKKETRSPESVSRLAGQRGEMTLWYRQPAVKWLEAMPLGNGLTAAMVFGGTKMERIACKSFLALPIELVESC
jgi:Glycosyl hydrolase family 65, N-terminal domain